MEQSTPATLLIFDRNGTVSEPTFTGNDGGVVVECGQRWWSVARKLLKWDDWDDIICGDFFVWGGN